MRQPGERSGRPAAVLVSSMALWALVPSASMAAGPPAQVVITNGPAKLGETPVVVEVGDALPVGDYRLKGAQGHRDLAANVFVDDTRTFLAVVVDRLDAGEVLRLKAEAAEIDQLEGVQLLAKGRRVAVLVDGKPLTEYIPDDGPKPYLDPLIGPTGQPFTRGWPMREVEGEPRDHPHHRSMWFAHYKVNGVNTWDEHPGHGSIVESARPTVASGAAAGVLRTVDDWLGPDGKKACADERVVRFYATKGARILDFDATIRATDGPVVVGDNKDGVFGVRVAGPMSVTSKKGGKITNSEGQVDAKAWGQPASWVDYTGPVGGKTVGIAMLNRPDSFRYPTTWHVRDYGLFAANPFGWKDFGQKRDGSHEIPRGGSVTLRHRVILHEGPTDPAQLAEWFEGYARPPKVVIEPGPADAGR